MTAFTTTPSNYPINADTPLRRVEGNSAPTVTKNFILGDEFLDKSTGNWWKLANNPAGGLIWVLIGGSSLTTPIDSINVDASTPPGTDPVLPTALGLITMTGGQVATGTVGANVIRTNSAAANTLAVEIQRSTAVALADSTKNGVAHFDSSMFSVDGNGFVTLSGGGQAVDSFIPDSGTSPVVPTVTGQVTMTGGTLSAGTNATTVIGGTNSLTFTSINTAKWIVDPTVNRGTHTTIQGAITAASSGQTIFVRPGTYTEDLTLKAGVNIAAFDCDALTPNVKVIGKATMTTAGTVSISGIQFETNSDFILAVTGSAASQVLFKNCYFMATNSTAISHSSSSADSQISLINCAGILGGSPFTWFNSSSAGDIDITYGVFFGDSTGASTMSGAGQATLSYSEFSNPFSASGAGTFVIEHCLVECQNTNTTCFTTTGTGTHTLSYTGLLSGTSSAASIGAGTTATATDCYFSSSNTNAATGAGTFIFSCLGLPLSNVINPTTITRTYTDLGKYKATGQPSYSVYLANALTNVTGDGTIYQIVFDAKEFDTDNNVTLGGTTFLTPVEGKYRYTLNILLTNIDVAHTSCNLNIVTSAGITFQCNPAAIQTSLNAATVAVSGIDIAGAGESITCTLQVNGGTKTVGIAAGANFSYWDCSLIC